MLTCLRLIGCQAPDADTMERFLGCLPFIINGELRTALIAVPPLLAREPAQMPAPAPALPPSRAVATSMESSVRPAWSCSGHPVPARLLRTEQCAGPARHRRPGGLHPGRESGPRCPPLPVDPPPCRVARLCPRAALPPPTAATNTRAPAGIPPREQQVRALEREMTARLEQQGLADLTPHIVVATRLIPGARVARPARVACLHVEACEGRASDVARPRCCRGAVQTPWGRAATSASNTSTAPSTPTSCACPSDARTGG